MTNEIMTRCADVQIKEDGTLQFNKLGEISAYSEMVVEAGMAPKGMTANQCTVAIIAGAGLGLNPFAAMQGISVINGRPALWGDAMVAVVMASGLLADIQTEYLPDAKNCRGVRVTAKRKGIPTPFVGTFTLDQAQHAGLLNKGTWAQYPTRMLVNRARAYALRDAFPDILKGFSTVEEARDTETIQAQATISPAPYAETATAPTAPAKPRKTNTLRDALKMPTERAATTAAQIDVQTPADAPQGVLEGNPPTQETAARKTAEMPDPIF